MHETVRSYHWRSSSRRTPAVDSPFAFRSASEYREHLELRLPFPECLVWESEIVLPSRDGALSRRERATGLSFENSSFAAHFKRFSSSGAIHDDCRPRTTEHYTHQRFCGIFLGTLSLIQSDFFREGPARVRQDKKLYEFFRKLSMCGWFSLDMLRDKCLNSELFLSLQEARVVVENRRMECNIIRPHSSLGRIPPAAYAAELHTNWP